MWILMDTGSIYKHSRILRRSGLRFRSVYLIYTNFLSMGCELRTIVAWQGSCGVWAWESQLSLPAG